MKYRKRLTSICLIGFALLLATFLGQWTYGLTFGSRIASMSLQDQKEHIAMVVIRGESKSLEKILNENPSLVNSTDTLGKTPLFYALRNGDEKAVKIILSKGADPNICTKNDRGPHCLYMAANRSYSLVKILIAKGADITRCQTGPYKCLATSTNTKSIK